MTDEELIARLRMIHEWKIGKIAADRIEELKAERDALIHDLGRLKQSETDAINRAEAAEAKLAKAVCVIEAETRAKVIEEAQAVCDEVIAGREEQLSAKYDFTVKARFRAGILQTKFVREKLDALHTEASRNGEYIPAKEED